MPKKSKVMKVPSKPGGDVPQTSTEKENDITEGCNCPQGCLVGSAISANPGNRPKDLVWVVCDNDSCPLVPYQHEECYDKWEKFLITARLHKGNRSMSNLMYDVIKKDLWHAKVYDMVVKFCRCACGQGFLRRPVQDEMAEAAVRQQRRRQIEEEQRQRRRQHLEEHGSRHRVQPLVKPKVKENELSAAWKELQRRRFAGNSAENEEPNSAAASSSTAEGPRSFQLLADCIRSNDDRAFNDHLYDQHTNRHAARSSQGHATAAATGVTRSRTASGTTSSSSGVHSVANDPMSQRRARMYELFGRYDRIIPDDQRTFPSLPAQPDIQDSDPVNNNVPDAGLPVSYARATCPTGEAPTIDQAANDSASGYGRQSFINALYKVVGQCGGELLLSSELVLDQIEKASVHLAMEISNMGGIERWLRVQTDRFIVDRNRVRINRARTAGTLRAGARVTGNTPSATAPNNQPAKQFKSMGVVIFCAEPGSHGAVDCSTHGCQVLFGRNTQVDDEPMLAGKAVFGFMAGDVVSFTAVSSITPDLPIEQFLAVKMSLLQREVAPEPAPVSAKIQTDVPRSPARFNDNDQPRNSQRHASAMSRPTQPLMSVKHQQPATRFTMPQPLFPAMSSSLQPSLQHQMATQQQPQYGHATPMQPNRMPMPQQPRPIQGFFTPIHPANIRPPLSQTQQAQPPRLVTIQPEPVSRSPEHSPADSEVTSPESEQSSPESEQASPDVSPPASPSPFSHPSMQRRMVSTPSPPASRSPSPSNHVSTQSPGAPSTTAIPPTANATNRPAISQRPTTMPSFVSSPYKPMPQPNTMNRPHAPRESVTINAPSRNLMNAQQTSSSASHQAEHNLQRVRDAGTFKSGHYSMPTQQQPYRSPPSNHLPQQVIRASPTIPTAIAQYLPHQTSGGQQSAVQPIRVVESESSDRSVILPVNTRDVQQQQPACGLWHSNHGAAGDKTNIMEPSQLASSDSKSKDTQGCFDELQDIEYQLGLLMNASESQSSSGNAESECPVPVVPIQSKPRSTLLGLGRGRAKARATGSMAQPGY